MSEGITITFNAETKEAAGKIQEFFGKIGENLDKLTEGAAFLSGLGERIAEVFTITAIIEGFNQAVESMEALGRAAQKTSLSIETLWAMSNLGRREGLAFDEITSALGLLNDKIFMAVRLGGDAARPFRDLNIAITDTEGALLPTEAILTQVMDRFRGLPGGPQKAAEAMELFGRAGRELIPILNEGSQALEEMKAEGSPVNKEDVENAKEFHAAISDLKDGYNTLFVTVAKDILPILQDFADWLQKVIVDTHGQTTASEGLEIVFRALATAAVDLKSVFILLGEVIGNALGLAFENLKDEVSTLIVLFGNFRDLLKANAALLLDVAQTAATTSGILGKMAVGDYQGAWEQARASVNAFKQDLQSAGSAVSAGINNVVSFTNRTKARMVGVGKLMFGELMEEATNFTNALNSLWQRTQGGKKTSAASGEGGEPGKAGGSATIISTEAKKLIDEVNKAYQEATLGKIGMLDVERDQLIEKLTQEINDTKLAEEEKAKVVEIFARKRREIEEKNADEKKAGELENVRAQIADVQQDPDLITSERKAKLLPLIQQEKDLLNGLLQVEQQRAADPNRNVDEQAQAEKRVGELQQQLTRANTEGAKAQQTPLQKAMLQLRSMNDLQQEVAQNFASVFNNAISSISQGITGLLEQTESWSQALTQIGASILNSIISSIVEMGVRWVSTQLMMALYGRTLAAASTAALAPIALAQSAIWAVPATLATIASYGGAAEAAPGLIAIAEGLTLGTAAFAEGGMVNGPGTGTSDSILAWLSRGEFVIPASVVSQWGPEYFESLRTGRAPTAAQAIAGLARPVTSDPKAFQQMVASGASARSSAGAGNVSVQGHKMSVAFVNSRNEMRDYLSSAQGEKHVVDIARRRRLDIGITT